MFTRRVTEVALLGLLAGVGAGCTASDEYAPEFTPNQGRAPGATAVTYAAGPYGISVGSTIADMSFQGFPDTASGPVEEDAVPVRLSDFYNPTLDGRWSADSPFGDKDKPAALLLIGSAEWCGPCQYEAQTILPESHAIYAAGQCGNGVCGAAEDHDTCEADCPNPEDTGGFEHTGEFLLALQEGLSGTFSGSVRPAEMTDVLDWVDAFSLDYPAASDPHYKLFQYTGEGAFPGILLIRTKDMKIINVHIGALNGAIDVWNEFQDVLHDLPVLPEDFD